MNVKIKKLTIENLADLDNIEPECDASSAIKETYKLCGYCLIAYVTSIPVGYLLVYPSLSLNCYTKCIQRFYTIDNITIHKKYRKKGIGSVLLKNALNRLNNKKIIIFVRPTQWLINWYKKYNFKLISSEIPNLIGIGDNGFIMSTSSTNFFL